MAQIMSSTALINHSKPSPLVKGSNDIIGKEKFYVGVQQAEFCTIN